MCVRIRRWTRRRLASRRLARRARPLVHTGSVQRAGRAGPRAWVRARRAVAPARRAAGSASRAHAWPRPVRAGLGAVGVHWPAGPREAGGAAWVLTRGGPGMAACVHLLVAMQLDAYVCVCVRSCVCIPTHTDAAGAGNQERMQLTRLTGRDPNIYVYIYIYIYISVKINVYVGR